MMFQEKRALVSLLTTLVVLGVYVLYLFRRFGEELIVVENDFSLWGKAFLWFIPVMIVAQIIIHIVFIIINKIVTNEDAPSITDERDKLIELKSTRVSYWVFTIGFLISMASQAMGKDTYVMFVILTITAYVSPVMHELTKIILYRRGV